MLLRRLNYGRTTGIILRRTWPDLYKSHIVKLFEEFPPLQSYWNQENRELRLPNGSRLFFGYAEHARDLAAFESSEMADIMIDEAQQFSQDEIERLRVINRCTSNGAISPKMLLTFMPGLDESGIPPIGLPYLKRVFVDGKLEAAEQKRKWTFIQAFAWDNIEWCRNELAADGVTEVEFYSWPNERRQRYFLERTEYGATMASMTNEALRDAWLYGKWDVFQGQYFPHFSTDRHVQAAAEVQRTLQPWWRFFISGDWGFDHPHAVYFHAVDENRHVYTFDELWGREVGEKELAQRINDRVLYWTTMFARQRAELERKPQPLFRYFVFSFDAGKLSPRSLKAAPKSILQLMTDELHSDVPRPFPNDSAPGTRVSRARLTSQLLENNYWTISDRCEKLIGQIPTLVRDPDNTEDVLKVDFPENKVGDDAYDGASMGLQYEFGATPVKPMAVERKELLESFDERIERVRRLREAVGARIVPEGIGRSAFGPTA